VRRGHLVELTVDGVLTRSGVDGAQLPECSKRGLALLLDDLAGCRQLSAFGTYLAGQEITRAVQNAALLGQMKTVPPQRQATIVIGGLPRTGTTLLQSLLSCDPAADSLRHEQTYSPLTSDAAETRDLAIQRLEMLHRISPDFENIHPMSIDGPEECTALLDSTLVSLNFAVLFQVRNYTAWLCQGEDTSSMDEAYSLLLGMYGRLFSHSQREILLMKSPMHLLGYMHLGRIVPTMRLVQIYRDPAEVLSSWLSLVAATSRLTLQQPADPGREASTWASFWRECISVAEKSKSEPILKNQISLDYRQLVEDPMRQVDRIYSDCEIPLSSVARSRMNEWIARHHIGTRPKDTYTTDGNAIRRASIDDFGAAYADLCGL
jgi:hypothetical protein